MSKVLVLVQPVRSASNQSSQATKASNYAKDLTKLRATLCTIRGAVVAWNRRLSWGFNRIVVRILAGFFDLISSLHNDILAISFASFWICNIRNWSNEYLIASL